MEESPRGLWQRFAKPRPRKGSRGFESHFLRWIVDSKAGLMVSEWNERYLKEAGSRGERKRELVTESHFLRLRLAVARLRRDAVRTERKRATICNVLHL